MGWLTRLGILEDVRAGDVNAAIGAWSRAAALARSAGDDAIARDLYERVREVAPLDVPATQRLCELLERAEAWDRLPELYAVLLQTATEPADAISALMRSARVSAERLSDPAAAAQAAERAFTLGPSDREVLTAYERYAIAAAAGHAIRFARVLEGAIAQVTGEDAESLALRGDLALARSTR